MGVILYVLLAGFLPFEENTMIALFLKIKNADFTYPSWFSRDVRTLLDKVLVSDPTKRLTLNELKHHHWLVEGLASPDAPGSTGHDDSHSNATEAVEASRKEVAAAHAKNPLPSHNRTPPASQPPSPTKPTSTSTDAGHKSELTNGHNGAKVDAIKNLVPTASSTSQSSPNHSSGNDRQSSPSPSPRLTEPDKPSMTSTTSTATAAAAAAIDGKAQSIPTHGPKATAAGAVLASAPTSTSSTAAHGPEHTAAKNDLATKQRGKEKEKGKDASTVKTNHQACCSIA